MFYHALYKSVFHEGIHIYLTKTTSNPEGVAEPIHFYNSLQQALPEDSSWNIKEFFETWEHQAGFPYVTVERNYNGNQVKFSQQRFLSSGSDNTSLWYIPITYSTNINNLNVVKSFWTNDRSREIVIDDIRPNNILIVNINQEGYYRVFYDESNWMLIANFLYKEDFSEVSPSTRAMLIDDATIFAENGMLNIRILLEIVKHLEKDVRF